MIKEEICTRCQELQQEGEILRELAFSRERSISEISRQISSKRESPLREQAQKFARKRREREERELRELEERMRELEEAFAFRALDELLQGRDIEEIAQKIMEDATRRALEREISNLRWGSEEISEEDVRKALEEMEKEGYIDLSEGKVRITPRGAKKLANTVLERILRNLKKRELGTHAIRETGLGMELDITCRRYEPGDDYTKVNVEKTLLSALERTGKLSPGVEDFHIHEEIYETRICAGLLIDESGSMRNGGKLNAAIEAALALAELMRREPKDKLYIFIFSDTVRQISHWDILNVTLSGGYTDIRAAMRAFRNATRNERGDKQVYLITDSEPNFEDGRFIGFDKAALGVLDEAIRWRHEGLTLNIIMLDQSAELRTFASFLAQKNAGRVFFTSPEHLGEVIIKDYLYLKQGRAL